MGTYEARYNKALINEHTKVFGSDGKLKESSREELNQCPVCNSKGYKIYCIKDMFVHKQCKNCGLVYLDPKLNRQATLAFYNSEVNEIYNEKKFHTIERNAPDDLENISNYNILRKYITNLTGKRLLEIGPGRGTFLAKAANDGFEVHAIELNNLLIENLKKITNHVYTDDIENIDLPENFFDVIYFRDVMEHIDVPIPFLKKIHTILKPEGILLIDTHNIDSIVNGATKECHTVIFPFEHPLHWSPKTLSLAGKMAGLETQKVYFNYTDLSLARIIHYHLVPSFTFIFPPERSKLSKFILGKISRILEIKPIHKLDKSLCELIARITRKGAKMQVLFTKK